MYSNLYYSQESREKKCYYPIFEKVLMWVNIQCKVVFKIKGDHGKCIIYTVKERSEGVQR
jgi:hypothetical protein